MAYIFKYNKIYKTTLCLFLLLTVVLYCPHSYAKVRHNFEIYQQIKSRLKIEKSIHNKAILKGLKWTIEFIDKDQNFDFIFSDLILMFFELEINKQDKFIQNLSHKLIQDSFSRAESQLKNIFPKTIKGTWDFYSILPFLYKYKINIEPYQNFYQSYLPKDNDWPKKKDFYKAANRYDYDTTSDYIIDYSFIQLFKEFGSQSDFKLPQNLFLQYMNRLKKMLLIYPGQSSPQKFSDQNYYVTHVVMTLTHYGLKPIKTEKFEQYLLKYLLYHFDTIRFKVHDLDLLAEYIWCLKVFRKGNSPKVQEAIQYLYSQQHQDGSWGRKEDKSGTPYDEFHPTWAVLTALYYPQ